MACGESGGSKILLCLGLLAVVSSFCHCTRLTRLKALDRLRGNSTLSKGQTEGGDLRHGRLLIGQNLLQADELKGIKATESFLDVDTDYQEDMGWGELKQPKGQGNGISRPTKETDSAAVERLLRMEPKVECTGDSMKLRVQDAASTPGSLVFVDRGSRMSPLPLSKLPPSCGYTIKSTLRDLVLVAPYNGCFVALEEDSYVLPLRWWGLPVRMSCPLMRQSSPNPPMVTCHAEGMVVKTTWTVSVADINLKLNGNWEPLMKASPRCGFSVVVHPEGVVISVRYAPCLDKKDGMYTLELAGDGETKISCPSLSPAQTEQPKKPAKGSETPSKGERPTTPSTKNPEQSVVPQVPKIPEAPNKKPNQEPKDINQPQLPSYPNYFYPFPVKPDTNPAPTVQPSPQTAPPVNLPVTPRGQMPQPFIPPFYPWAAQPEVPVAKDIKDKTTAAPKPSEPEASQGQVHQPFYPYPFPYYPQPQPEKPTAAPKPEPEAPQGQVQQPFHPFPYYPQPEPEKPTAAPKPPQPEAPQGQVQQPFYPFPYYPQPEPEKPTAAPKPEPEAPRGQVQQPFYPFPYYPQPEPEKPTAAPKPSQPEAPQGQVQQPFYPQPEPEKPTAAPKPPQPEAPQGQVQQPFYPQPEPEKPTAAPKPPQPEAPQGQVQQPFYPFPYYPQPEPEKPTGPKPAQPEAPQGQVQQPFYPYPLPYYPQPQPERPTAAPKPPQPEAPQGQVQQPFYPQPEPEKPTAAPKPPQPEAPQGQVQQPFYPFPYNPQPEPEKPTAPKPAQPEAPQGQVQQPFYPYPLPYYPQPQPERPTAAPKPPQPEAPQGQVQQPFYPQPEPEKPTAAPKPPQPEAPQGQVQQPFYPYPLPYYPQPQPERPTAAPKPPQPEAPQGQVQQPFYPQPEPEKPTAAPKPPQPEAPQGQVQQPFYPYPLPYYPQPQPERPTAAPKPPQPEAPQGQVQQPFYPQPEPEKPTAAPKPPQPEAPEGQIYQSFYPYPFPYYPQPQPEKPTAPKPTQPEAPQGQVQQPFYPQPEPEKPTAAPKPPQPEAPQGQVQQPFYPYPFPYYPQPQPEKPTAPKPPQPEAPQGQVQQPFYPQPQPERPTAAPKPPQPEAPQGQVQQPFYPYPFPYYPQPQPEKPTAPKPAQPEAPQGQVQQPFYPQPQPERPTAAPKPPQPEAPQGQVQQPFYPYPFYRQPAAVPKPPATETPKGQEQKPAYPQPPKIPGAGTNGDKAPTQQPPAVNLPEGQMHYPFYPYFYPQAVTLPPAVSNQQPQPDKTSTNDQNPPKSAVPPVNGGKVPQDLQPDSPYMPPVYCPRFCPPGFSNCCPQIAFHQHLHQIIPAAIGSENAPLHYPVLPFLPSKAYTELGSAPPPLKSTEATATQATSAFTSAPVSSQSLPSGNEKQPLDGNPAAPSNPSMPTDHEQPIYPYIAPNSLYPNWPYLLQNLPQSQSPAHYNMPSKPQAPGSEPVNPALQYEPPNLQQQNGQPSGGDMNNPSGPNFMPYSGQYPKQQQSQPTKALQPSSQTFSEPKGPVPPKVQSELDPFVFPHYMHQDGRSEIQEESTAPNTPSKKSPKPEHNVHPYSDSKNYVLLQHGPPGRDLNRLNESPLHFRNPVGDGDLLAQNPARHHGNTPQHLQNSKPPQEKPQHPKQPGKEMSNPFPNVNYMPRPGDNSEGVPFFSLNGPHFASLPQDPSVNTAQLNPKFRGFWRPVTPLGSGQRIQPLVPGKAFKRRSSAADHQAKGLNQPIQREVENWKP